MKSMLGSQAVLRLGLILFGVLTLLGGGLAFFFAGGSEKATAGSAEKEGGGSGEAVQIAVKFVRPQHNKNFKVMLKRPADVQPYYTAPLETRVPGIVKSILPDVGYVAREGEKLVEIDVPDRVAQKKQREADVLLAEARVDQRQAGVQTAEADYKAAQARIDAAKARWDADVAYEEYRRKQENRYRGLLAERAIDGRLVDEQIDQHEAAKEKTIASKQAWFEAKAMEEAAKARIVQAKADLRAAVQNVNVTKADLAYAQAMLDYGTIKAPFDGEIVQRNVHPGFFVQNAGDGRATPLLIIQRNDIVTINMRVPDYYATYITPKTEAIFETPSLSGLKIHGKVTRYPQSLVTPEKDRTMLVEVDLWNRSKAEFEKKMKSDAYLTTLKPGLPGDPDRGRPVVPDIQGSLETGRALHLMPGMFGTMTLVLQRFKDIYLLPSRTVITKGGVKYIYVVRDGKAHLQQVEIVVDDGNMVKVNLIDESGEVTGNLTGKEDVIATNQGELDEGAPVAPVLVEDWGALKHLEK
jgi:multidrug efflux pump subunit AcrA (membrane-fusion protein)